MKNKLFEVKVFYSGYCTHEVLAINKEDAITKARNLEVNKNELLSNLESWKDADEVIEIEVENEKRDS